MTIRRALNARIDAGRHGCSLIPVGRFCSSSAARSKGRQWTIVVGVGARDFENSRLAMRRAFELSQPSDHVIALHCRPTGASWPPPPPLAAALDVTILQPMKRLFEVRQASHIASPAPLNDRTIRDEMASAAREKAPDGVSHACEVVDAPEAGGPRAGLLNVLKRENAHLAVLGFGTNEKIGHVSSYILANAPQSCDVVIVRQHVPAASTEPQSGHHHEAHGIGWEDVKAILFRMGMTVAVVLFWRGTWLTLDHYLFPDDLIKSGLCSLAVGYSAIAIAMAFQKRIGGRIAHIEGPLMRSVAKFGYMYLVGLAVVFSWRGIWVTCDGIWQGAELQSAFGTHIAGLVLLAFQFGHLASALAPPIVKVCDHRDADTFLHPVGEFKRRAAKVRQTVAATAKPILRKVM
ncbi:unnamed protein product [Vitrella brassicaformis CCMP3155]|uniref:Uncharacterized protein n=1 Tax=Vitrella brassicaformis (strain CCMP3155) TaxID=1169540 RepID=A0A0G4FWW8_VITBC|nr:unnamed protein product [Vitrella brassicaformis CCMP3155]|mmetsp:Transcript_37240/g.93505  ORF Transcript_37240/g.93505 Transcript_37240/m.93505 type:complete len:405 (-) Transcript_37240:67-1281(-)|eukprot:CEM19648.1 unnamed protein product [Vitrella brassicaformis CCMP3155]